MDAERAREFLLKLPLVVETQQWGDNLVYWVGDKTQGGKMFALLNLDAAAGTVQHGVASFAAGPERFAEMLERDGLKPAPYMARAFWIAADHWGALKNAEWEAELSAAREIIFAKMPKRTRELLEMTPKERAKVLAARKKK